MEKQPAKRRGEEDGSIVSIDRISELPQPILHHILSFFSQKEAIKTCVLSKSWRYLGSTRPKIDFRGICFGGSKCSDGKRFCESCFGGNKEALLSAVDTTLRRYNHQNLSTHEFILGLLKVDSESISLLEKWVPTFISNNGVRTFNLCFSSEDWAYFDLPPVVFKSESLEKLYLHRCKLNQINSIECVISKHLQTLCLARVYIADETLEWIISSCPRIDCLSLRFCEGLRSIKMINNHHNLKEFDFCAYHGKNIGDQNIEIDVPTLKTIRIVDCPSWYHHDIYFSQVKSLYLHSVKLSTMSFDCFSYNFPSLEELSLIACYGFEEFQLLSRSIKHLTILDLKSSIKASVDAANILYFRFSGDFPISRISFTKALSEWKSNICVNYHVDSNNDVLPWFLKLDEMLKALSQSKISLCLYFFNLPNQQIEGVFNELVVVESLSIILYKRVTDYSSSSVAAFLNSLFCIFHPRYTNQRRVWENDDYELSILLCKVLIQEREKRDYFWQKDLEQVSIEVLDKNGKQWHPVQGTSLPECALSNKQNIRFLLKWRD